MNYLLDTNILLIYLRDKKTREFIENEYDPFGQANTPIISVVSIGEIKSIALRNSWGERKIERLMAILDELIITDINSQDVINMYAEIDCFSQGKSKSKSLNTTARNMGKNDLWIAATGAVLQTQFLTTDKDFKHLDGQYLNLKLIEREN